MTSSPAHVHVFYAEDKVIEMWLNLKPPNTWEETPAVHSSIIRVYRRSQLRVWVCVCVRGQSWWPCQPDFHQHQDWITQHNSWNTHTKMFVLWHILLTVPHSDTHMAATLTEVFIEGKHIFIKALTSKSRRLKDVLCKQKDSWRLLVWPVPRFPRISQTVFVRLLLHFYTHFPAHHSVRSQPALFLSSSFCEPNEQHFHPCSHADLLKIDESQSVDVVNC